MNKTHEQLLARALEEDFDLRAYDLEDLDEYSHVYMVGDIPVFAHFHFPKELIKEPDYQIEVLDAQAVVNVLNDRSRLFDFVKAIAEGENRGVEVAKPLLASLSSERI